jgi:hypothetical protein
MGCIYGAKGFYERQPVREDAVEVFDEVCRYKDLLSGMG